MNPITRSTEVLSNDARRARWAAIWYGCGLHRQPYKPRIRIPITVPQPLREPSRADATPLGVGSLPRAAAADGGGTDWFESDECAAILAQPVEHETENPFAHDREPDPEIDA